MSKGHEGERERQCGHPPAYRKSQNYQRRVQWHDVHSRLLP